MAGRFPSEWIDEVRDRSDIVSVVSEYVPLKRKGAKFWGLCPFHGEKTPSFSVDAERQLYYCFGCHAGGNVITFVMNMERMEFPEAVVHLAERAHMEVPERTGADPAPKKDRDRLYAALTAAAKFYYKTLYSPQGERALQYLHGRGIRDNVIRRFGLGATAAGHASLTQHLKEQGFSDKELTEANLALERGGRVFDTFRDRVMFPIFDPRGRVIAFGGRVIGQGEPKYLNSGDTPVFNKRRNVYGLNFLKGGRRDRLRLVEGYMDVVSLYQHGVDGCVATLGTALTPEQIRLMKRYAPEILLTYDGDGAGQRAIARGLDLFEAERVPARVTVVPDKMDPDEFVRARGGQALEELGSVDATRSGRSLTWTTPRPARATRSRAQRSSAAWRTRWRSSGSSAGSTRRRALRAKRSWSRWASAPPRRTRRGAWTPPSPTEWRARGAERLKRRTAPCAPSGSWPRSLPRASACRRG